MIWGAGILVLTNCVVVLIRRRVPLKKLPCLPAWLLGVKDQVLVGAHVPTMCPCSSHASRARKAARRLAGYILLTTNY